jgi:hypothetical protein
MVGARSRHDGAEGTVGEMVLARSRYDCHEGKERNG